MTTLLHEIKASFLHLVFPRLCEGCGTDLVETDEMLCLRCLSDLPQTNYHFYYNNPIEKLFWGRMEVQQASAQYYFTKESRMQQLMHQLKYRGNKSLGLYLGRLMGRALLSTHRFSDIDILVPMPLHASRERARGYNQAALLCSGISEVINKPVLVHQVTRTTHTDTQTRKSRVDRWQNMEGRFGVQEPAKLQGKHILLVDDVVTTGASLESCGSSILQVSGTELSICTLCYASQV